MKTLKLKGNTVEEKLVHIERILGHFQGKLGNKVIGYVPGIPMSAFAQSPLEDGTLVSFVMTANGSVKTGVLVVRQYNSKTAVEFKVVLERATAKYEEKFLTKKEVHKIDIGFDVEIGDIITILVSNPKTDGDKSIVEKVWVGLLLEVDYKASGANKFKEFLIDELKGIEDEGIRELTDNTE